ncbi:MAG TPA: hypothetical protein VK445_02485 [Dissulfurispiraceae bacterium]|nr:hypothetical protein [Dissulfurispiraceae bacterium]
MTKLILCFFLCMLLITVQAFAGAGPSPFISIFSCDGSSPKEIDEDICLVGVLKEGLPVYLLSDEVLCQAETREAVMLEREVGAEFMMTPVEWDGCDNADYYLAYRGRQPKNFESLEFEEEDSAAIRTSVDTAVRNGHLTAAMNNTFAGTLKSEPLLYKPFAKRSDMFLAQYATSRPSKEDDVYGPLFWYAKGSVKLIDAQARIAAVFRIDGRLYFMLQHECWDGCGEYTEKVYSLSEKGFVLVYQNSALSE